MSTNEQKLPVPLISNKPRLSQTSEKYKIQNILRNFETLQLRKLLRLSGDNNRYQIFMLICLSIIAKVQSFFIISLFFQFVIPDFNCISPSSSTPIQCSLSQFCSAQNELIFSAKVKSVAEHFSLLCQPQSALIKLMSYIFLSSVLLSSPLVLLNRVFGRKWSLCCFGLVQIGCCLVILHTKTLYWFSFAVSLNISCALVWLISSFLYVIESSGPVFHSKCFVVFTLSAASSMISCSFFSHNFADFTSLYLVLVMTLIVSNVFYLSMVQSPVYLKNNASIFRFYVSLREITRMNFSPQRALNRKQRIKNLLFDQVDPSRDATRLSSENSFSLDVPKSQENSPHLKSLPLNHRQIRKNKRALLREQIFGLSLSNEAPLRVAFPAFLAFFYFAFSCLFASFFAFIFWFSLLDPTKFSIRSNSLLLSFSFFLGVLTSNFLSPHVPSSLPVLGNLLCTCFLLFVVQLSPPISDSPQLAQISPNPPLFNSLVFGFNYFAGLGFFSTFRNSLASVKKDLQLLVTILVIWAFWSALALGAFFTNRFLENNVPVYWSIFAVAVLALPLSLLSPKYTRRPSIHIR